MPTVTDIFRQHLGTYLAQFGRRMPERHVRAARDIADCGTERMGGRILVCDTCGSPRPVFHSCRNRACPRCHAKETVRWLGRRAGELLPVAYHHAVFTVPSELRRLLRDHPREALGALMKAAAEALQTLAADPQYGGGRLAILAVLHTWSAALLWHPHVHCLVPAVVVRPDGSWEKASGRFLLPVRALSPIFRAKFAALLRTALPGTRLPDSVWRIKWNVYSRPCCEGPGNVLRYLARYVFSGPMSSRRIIGFENGRYKIQYRDNETRELRTVRLTPHEFMRRYLQHVLPSGFHRVRYYGLWAPAARTRFRALQIQLGTGGTGLAALVERLRADSERFADAQQPRCCPRCGSTACHLERRWFRTRLPPSACRGPPR